MRGERIIRQKRIWGFVILAVILIFGSIPYFLEPEPAGSKSKTVKSYVFVEKLGEFKEVLNSVARYKYDEKGNRIEEASYKADGSLSFKLLYKYDAKGNELESTTYRYELKFGKLMEIPEQKTTTEYEYY